MQGWLLHLWDIGTDGIVLSGDELTPLASITTQPSLWQNINGAIQCSENASLFSWLKVGYCTAWPNEEDLLEAQLHWTSIQDYKHSSGK